MRGKTFSDNAPVLQLEKELQEGKTRKTITEEGEREPEGGADNWKFEEHVKLPRERKPGRLPAVSKHGKPVLKVVW